MKRLQWLSEAIGRENKWSMKHLRVNILSDGGMTDICHLTYSKLIEFKTKSKVQCNYELGGNHNVSMSGGQLQLMCLSWGRGEIDNRGEVEVRGSSVHSGERYKLVSSLLQT